MPEKLYVYNPEYENFVHRAFRDYTVLISIIAFMFWNIFSILNQLNWIIIVVIDILLSFSFIGVPIKYIYYISSIIISEESRTIKIELYKLDKIIKNDEIKIENIDIRIVDHWFYRHSVFELRLYSNGKCISKQRETNYWKVKLFNEIKKIIIELKQNSTK